MTLTLPKTTSNTCGRSITSKIWCISTPSTSLTTLCKKGSTTACSWSTNFPPYNCWTAPPSPVSKSCWLKVSTGWTLSKSTPSSRRTSQRSNSSIGGSINRSWLRPRRTARGRTTIWWISTIRRAGRRFPTARIVGLITASVAILVRGPSIQRVLLLKNIDLYFAGISWFEGYQSLAVLRDFSGLPRVPFEPCS